MSPLCPSPGGTQHHALRLHPPHLLGFEVAEQHHEPVLQLLLGDKVHQAADHGAGLGLAHVDLLHVEAVGIRVLPGGSRDGNGVAQKVAVPSGTPQVTTREGYSKMCPYLFHTDHFANTDVQPGWDHVLRLRVLGALLSRLCRAKGMVTTLSTNPARWSAPNAGPGGNSLPGIPCLFLHQRAQSFLCWLSSLFQVFSRAIFESGASELFSDLSSWRDSVPPSPAWPGPHFPELPTPPYWLWLGWDTRRCSASSALGS